MIWTYLTNYKISSNVEIPYQNQLTFEQVDILDDNFENEFNNFTNGYKELLKDGFFDGFPDYNILFVSKYDPLSSPITKNKMFVLRLDN